MACEDIHDVELRETAIETGALDPELRIRYEREIEAFLAHTGGRNYATASGN